MCNNNVDIYLTDASHFKMPPPLVSAASPSTPPRATPHRSTTPTHDPFPTPPHGSETPTHDTPSTPLAEDAEEDECTTPIHSRFPKEHHTPSTPPGKYISSFHSSSKT